MPSAPDPLDPGSAGFAHRGLHDASGVPENSLIALAAALELGAGIETDLRLTGDNEVILFHDADAWRLCANPMRVGESTWQELARLRVGEHPIPLLASFLELVDGRVPLLLEIKVDDDICRWVPVLRRSLEGYHGRFGIMSFDPRLLRLIRTNMPEVRRGLLVEADLPPLRRRLYVSLAHPQFVAVEGEALAQRWVQRFRRRLPVYGWTIRTPAERAQAEVHADALIWEGDGRPRN